MLDDMAKFKKQDIIISRKNALDEIRKILDKGNVDLQFKDRKGGYNSSDKFLITWIGQYNGMPSQFGIDICDEWEMKLSGSKAIYATRSLLHEEQLGGYSTIERALLEIGLKLCPGKKEYMEFARQYIIPFNERIRQEKSNATENK